MLRDLEEYGDYKADANTATPNGIPTADSGFAGSFESFDGRLTTSIDCSVLNALNRGPVTIWPSRSTAALLISAPDYTSLGWIPGRVFDSPGVGASWPGNARELEDILRCSRTANRDRNWF